MIIKCFSTDKSSINNLNSDERFGIIDCRRHMYLFTTKDAYENNMICNCKAVIVNECVYDGRNFNMTHAIKIPNSIIVRNSVYFGEFSTEMPGDIVCGKFVVDNGLTKEVVTLPNGESIKYLTNTFSGRMLSVNDEILNQIRICDDDETICIPPEFYTEYQMWQETGDYCSLIDVSTQFDVSSKMSDLMRGAYDVVYMNITTYDTMRLQMAKRILEVESKYDNSICIPSQIGTGLDDYIGRRATFIFDSDANGMNQHGINIVNGKIPLGKFYNKDYLTNNLKSALNMFELNCKDIEELYGHVRIFYNPSELGNNCKIIFKDYKKSPIIPLSAIKNDGTINENLLNGTTKIDTGYSIERSTDENIDLASKSMVLDFNRDMQGW